MTTKTGRVPYSTSAAIEPSPYDHIIAGRIGAKVSEMLAEIAAAGGEFDWSSLVVDVFHPKGGRHETRGFEGYQVRVSVDRVPC